jgi:hypothetical protein
MLTPGKRGLGAALLALAAATVARQTLAQQPTPAPGWSATLSRISHNVSGTVTVVDADTLQVDNFTYDGGGLDVRFYLGVDATRAAFTSGLPVGPQLLGMAFSGSQEPLVLDLPAGQTIAGWNAISVWCVDVSVSFGQGTFALLGDFNASGAVDGGDLLQWQRGASPAPLSISDLGDWKDNFRPAQVATLTAVPEPTAAGLAGVASLLAAVVLRRGRDRFGQQGA